MSSGLPVNSRARSEVSLQQLDTIGQAEALAPQALPSVQRLACRKQGIQADVFVSKAMLFAKQRHWCCRRQLALTICILAQADRSMLGDKLWRTLKATAGHTAHAGASI